MKIHEYQAKAILAKYEVPVPRGEVAYTVEEAEAAAKKIGGSVVVKAQIHAGGRGKGGGVKIEEVAAKTPEAILRETLIAGQPLQAFQARKLAFAIGVPAASANAAAAAM